METKINIISEKLFKFFRKLNNEEILQEIDIDSERIVFVTNLGKKTFLNE